MRETRDTYFVNLLMDVASRSTCLRRSVGAILVDARGRILSTGYNGPPRTYPHCDADHPCAGATDPKGDTRRCLAVHAEQNALLQCWRLDLADTMYVSCSPCFVCAKLITQVESITRVVVAGAYADDLGNQMLVEQEKLWLYDFQSSESKLLAR